MRVRWLRAALRNLDYEAAYIAKEDPRAAARTVARNRRAVDHPGDHSEVGRPGRISGTRELVVSGTPYIVPYRVRNDRFEILRILHGARRWPRRF